MVYWPYRVLTVFSITCLQRNPIYPGQRSFLWRIIPFHFRDLILMFGDTITEKHDTKKHGKLKHVAYCTPRHLVHCRVQRTTSGLLWIKFYAWWLSFHLNLLHSLTQNSWCRWQWQRRRTRGLMFRISVRIPVISEVFASLGASSYGRL